MRNPYASRIDRLTREVGMRFSNDGGRFVLAWLEALHPLAADDIKAMLKKYHTACASGSEIERLKPTE